MLLERISVDRLGPMHGVQLGPFSRQLNAVYGPAFQAAFNDQWMDVPHGEQNGFSVAQADAGLAPLVRMIRDSITGPDTTSRSDAPYRWHLNTVGCVTWSGRRGLVHCRRETDGVRASRRIVDIESRGGQGMLRDVQNLGGVFFDQPLMLRFAPTGNQTPLPLSIIDGIITSVQHRSVNQIARIAVAAGLDRARRFSRAVEAGHRFDAATETHLQSLKHRIADLRQRISNRRGFSSWREERIRWEHRLARLQNQLRAWETQTADRRWSDSTTAHHAWAGPRLVRLRHIAVRLDNTADDLRRSIVDLDQQSHQLQNAYRRSIHQEVAPAWTISRTARRHLANLDAQMVRIRQAFRSIRETRQWLGERGSLRDAMASPAKWWQASQDHWFDDLETQPYRPDDAYETVQESSEKQGTAPGDWYGIDSEWNGHQASTGSVSGFAKLPETSYSGLPLGVSELESRLEAAYRHLDWLTSRYPQSYSGTLADELVDFQPSREFHVDDIASSLEHLKREIRGVTNTLAWRFHESEAPTPSWHHAGTPVNDEHPIGLDRTLERFERWDDAEHPLRRCEESLQTAFQSLVHERRAVLQQLASRAGVSVAHLTDVFGDWRFGEHHPENHAWWTGDSMIPTVVDPTAHADRVAFLRRDRDALQRELDQVLRRRSAVTEEARALKQRLRTPSFTPVAPETRDRILQEIEWAQRSLADLDALQRLETEYESLRRNPYPTNVRIHHYSQLAEAASGHLQRLTGGRMQRVEWETDHGSTEHSLPGNELAEMDLRVATRLIGEVRVDGQSEASLTLPQRWFACLAIRMAASDRLSALGAEIPLIIDDIGGIWNSPRDRSFADGSGHIPTWLEGLARFAESGRQTLLFTSHRATAQWVGERQGFVQSIDPVAYDTFDYRGHGTFRPLTGRRTEWQEAAHGSHRQTSPLAGGRLPGVSIHDVNRDFDLAYGNTPEGTAFDDPVFDVAPSAIEDPWARQRDWLPQDQWNHGTEGVNPSPGQPRSHANSQNMLHGDTPSNVHRTTQQNGYVRSTTFENGSSEGTDRPFFLTYDSPVDHAPSIDAVAAARLRGVGIVRVGQLVHADAEALAVQMRLADVDPTAVGRWQQESKLMCEVPKLRAFDARIMIGCGVTDAEELSEIEPHDLLQRVERFLGTSRGRQVLRTGSNYELSSNHQLDCSCESLGGIASGLRAFDTSASSRQANGNFGEGERKITPTPRIGRLCSRRGCSWPSL